MRCIFACKINEKQVILASAKPIFEMQLYVRSGQNVEAIWLTK